MSMLTSMSRLRLLLGGGLAIILLLGVILFAHGSGANGASGGLCGGTSASSPAMTQGAFTEYALPHANSGLMSSALDAQGNLWFGEMAGNRLGRLDPATQTITEWTPPHGRYGLMGMVVDAHNTVWYAEVERDYVGSFNVATCKFQMYPTTGAHGQHGGPTGLALAPDGKLWFALQTDNEIGVLDPASGHIQTYAVPGSSAGAPAVPYDVTVDHTGIVWFTELLGNSIDRLDPATGAIQRLPLPTPQSEPNTITTAPDGTIWFTEMSRAVLGRIDPQSNALSEYPAPATWGHPAQLYDVVIAPHGTVWLTSSGANSLLRFDMGTHLWTAASLPTPHSVPFGASLAADGAVWFTEGALGANRVGVYRGG